MLCAVPVAEWILGQGPGVVVQPGAQGRVVFVQGPSHGYGAAGSGHPAQT